MCEGSSKSSEAPEVFPHSISTQYGPTSRNKLCSASLPIFSPQDPSPGPYNWAEASCHISMGSPSNITGQELCCDSTSAVISRLEPVPILDPLKVVSWHL